MIRARIPASCALVAAALLAACDDPVGPRRYSEEEIAYFLEVVTPAPPGGESYAHKWESDPTIRFDTTNTTAEDRATVAHVVDELNDLVRGVQLRVEVDDTPPSSGIHLQFLPLAQIEAQYPDIVDASSRGMFHFTSTGGEILRGHVLIASDVTTQIGRVHVIHEEIAQVLGARADALSHPESIFYGGPSDATEYAPIDRQVLRMLYEPAIEPGMLSSEAGSILRELRS